MSQDSISSLSLKELHTGIHTGKFSVMEATDAYLNRIERLDGELNTYITVLSEQAKQQALAIDQKIRQGALNSPPIALLLQAAAKAAFFMPWYSCHP